jgi:hypothetical protein
MELIEFEETSFSFNFEENAYAIPPTALDLIAKHYENGSKKYADHNWAKGMNISRFYDSAFRHFNQHIIGEKDEPHLVASAWNIMGLIHTLEAMPSLNDMHVWEKDERQK